MRIAVVTDIHGNLRALEAVIADLKGQSPDLVVNLGDCVSGPLEAGKTAELLMSLNWPTVRGNHDRQLVDRPVAKMIPTDSAAHGHLDAAALAWLSTLPMNLAVEGLLLCHGSPSSDTVYLTEKVTTEGVVLAPPSEIAAKLGEVDQATVLCGHTHIPRLVRLPNGVTIVNPGSVGLQAFDDDRPIPHFVETGSPHARYVILDGKRDAWHPTFRAIIYDWDGASATARASGRMDWAHALATGFALR